MEKNLDITNPPFNEQIWPVPSDFVKSRFHCIEVLFHIFYCNFGRDIEIISFVISRTSLNRGSLNRGSTVPQKYIAICSRYKKRNCFIPPIVYQQLPLLFVSTLQKCIHQITIFSDISHRRLKVFCLEARVM